MTAPARLIAVSLADLPDYPISRAERLPELAFVKWIPSQWLQSKGFTRCTYECQGMARALFDLATAQSPIGTLPDDDEALAFLLHVDLSRWRAMRNLGDLGPLRNWVPCVSDGEVRLMHRVVTQQLEDVLARREVREMSRGAQAEAKRLARLSEGLVKAGLSVAIAGDAVLLARMDAWLGQTWRGNRTQMSYLRAIEQARTERWI